MIEELRKEKDMEENDTLTGESWENADFAVLNDAPEDDGAQPSETAPAQTPVAPIVPIAPPPASAAGFIQSDVLDFKARHPEMDADGLAALENNPQFRRFCGSRFGCEPLANLYEDYLALVGSAESAAAARRMSRSARSTGGGSSGGAALSPAQKRALEAWNNAHPDMAMTAGEFLKR